MNLRLGLTILAVTIAITTFTVFAVAQCFVSATTIQNVMK